MVNRIYDPRVQIIQDLMKNRGWYQREIYELLQCGIDSGTVIGTNGVLNVFAKAISAIEASFATASIANSIATIASTTIALNSAFLVGNVGLKVYQIYGQEERYIKEVSTEANWALINLIQDCLKNESFPKKDEKDVVDLGTDLNVYRNHEAFLAWIDLEYEKICGKQDKESLKNQKKYQALISQHIRPEAIKSGRFEEEMRIFCAANKILGDYGFKGGRSDRLKTPSVELAGEFAKSKPNTNAPFFSIKSWKDWWKDEGAKAQGGIAKQIQALLKPGHNFFDLKEKFYGAYKAKMYADCHQMEKISFFDEETKNINSYEIKDYVYSEYNQALAEALGIGPKIEESELNNEQKEKIRKFKRLFYQYRYEGGECEFNAHDFFKIRLFHKFYKNFEASKEDLSNFEKQLERQAKVIARAATTTLVFGSVSGYLNYLNSQSTLTQEAFFDEIKKFVGLRQQVKLGVPGAKEKYEFLQINLRNLETERYANCNLYSKDCINFRAERVYNFLSDFFEVLFDNIPLNEIPSYFREHYFIQFGDNHLRFIDEFFNMTLTQIEEIGSQLSV